LFDEPFGFAQKSNNLVDHNLNRTKFIGRYDPISFFLFLHWKLSPDRLILKVEQFTGYMEQLPMVNSG